MFDYNLGVMDFSGYEKLSLLDFDNYLSTTFFMAGCNFRCPFCHNSSLVLHPKKAPKIPWNELLSYLKKRQGVLEAVCISGGEPTLMPDLLAKLKEIKELGYIIKLDTNGTHPDVIKETIENRLIDFVAMDIKNSESKYSLTIGLKFFDIAPIKETISLLIQSAFPHEFRTTLIEEYHQEKDIYEIAKLVKGTKRFFLQRYIDSENCITHGLHMIKKEKALQFKALLEETIPFVSLRGYD